MQIVRNVDVQSLLPAPGEGSFLLDYCDYLSDICDAPMAYNVLTGLCLMAATAPASLELPGLPGGRVLSNFYAMIVGRPAVDHKTTALRLGTDLLADAEPNLLGDLNGSKEGIEESLAEPYSTRLFALPEMGDFLATAMDGYGAKLKASLTNRFDCSPINRRLARKMLNVPNPRVSCLGAVNLSMLRAHSRPNDWDGGFLSRWCTFHAHTEVDDPSGVVNQALRQYLVDWLAFRKQNPVGPCVGFDPDAREVWDAWSYNFRKHLQSLPSEAVVAAFGRTPTQAAKIALLLGYDYEATEDPWTISAVTVQRALGFAELHWKSIEGLSSLAHETRDARELQRFLDATPSTWTPYGEVMREMRITRGRANELVETLRETAELDTRVTTHGGFEIRKHRPLEERVGGDILALKRAAREP